MLRFGGTVAQHTGDGVLALFGAPIAHEDDAERAVRAALAMHAALAELAREVREAYGVEVVARAAVNTGPVVVPRGDEPAGRALQRARRHGQRRRAPASTCRRRWNSDRPAHGAPGGRAVSSWRPLGELELKGKTEPVAAFLVAGERAAETSVQAPLVGRDAELTVVEQAVRGSARRARRDRLRHRRARDRQVTTRHRGARPVRRPTCCSSRGRASRTRRRSRTGRYAS